MSQPVKEGKKEYPFDDIDIIELKDSTSQFISDFTCHISEIEQFLKDDALNQMKESVNRTFLWVSKNDRRLVAYITICADAIRLDDIKRKEMEEKNIKYKSLPALKIGRMGVRKDLIKQGIGKKMIFFAIKKAVHINEKCACRFITLDSKNDEEIEEKYKPIRFYKKMGFIELVSNKKKQKNIHMYRDLISIIQSESKL